MERWAKYSLLVMVSDLMRERGFNLGKTSMQKLIFLLREVFSVNPGYNFGLYIYGPYSEELTVDVEYLSSLQVLDVSYEERPSYRGFQIHPGKQSESVLEKSAAFIEANRDKIKQAVELFGNRTARELELRATIVYLRRTEKMEQNQLVERIRRIKPYFSEAEIISSITELQEMGYLN